MARIKYVGLKDGGEAAFIKQTGIKWYPGDAHEVSDAHAPLMLKHPDVFALDDSDAPLAASDDIPNFVDMTDEDVREWAKLRNIKPHHKKNGESLRAAVLEALKD